MITFKNLGKYGQLGNQLFQIASTVGIACANNQDYVFPRWKYSKFFVHPVPQTDALMDEYNVYKEPVKLWYKRIPLVLKGNWSLHGYFQSTKYFEPVEHVVRYYFEPKQTIKDKLLEKYGDVLKESCSIHVRRETKLDTVTKDSFWVPLPYYAKAMEFVKGVKNFLVFSNAIDWCEDHFKGSHFTFVKNQKDIEDLFLMSFCDHNIIGNSTFSWWAAWLNSNPAKKVVGPDPWLGWSRGDLNMASLVQEGWCKINIENMVFNPFKKVANNVIKLNVPMLPRFVRFALRKEHKKRLALAGGLK